LFLVQVIIFKNFFVDCTEYPAGTLFPDGARTISQVA